MKVKELMAVLDEIAPFKDSEKWDNTGLLVGNGEDEVTGILTTLDCAHETVDEAIEVGANVIIAHHPLIFPNVNQVVESGVGAVIRHLIRNDISLIAMHTNLDHQPEGVSHMIAAVLGVAETEVLIKHEYFYKKLRVNIPKENAEQLKQDLVHAGVGHQGDYSECFFQYPVKGQFRPGYAADPHIGTQGELEHVDEYIVEAIFEAAHEKQVIEALVASHPYEEPAYDVLTLKKPSDKGLGVKFDYSGTLKDLVSLIGHKTSHPVVNVVDAGSGSIRKVGIIGGSGMSYINEAFSEGIDVLVTGDVKYHEAYDAKLAGRSLIDAGHYIEALMAKGLKQLIEQRVDINVHATTISTNPFE
ncbi:Nif3-like dinuclear metal center hexameric protein [Salinicoccus sp. ID82-1]|uniref:Nif3-like dinuclear metal center hexameric protein n=1 Tax=Salinicoccus sp. ID82-1 TaxID=2820269 RepID=UPI001F032CDC|nr:Nif3-like dinuclear metal center hexameric protein [Salinicoccus sp. ID82-1]